jgi:hypothetical protein
MLGLGLGEGLNGGIPIADVAHRCVEGKAQCRLFRNPLAMVTGWAAAGNDLEAFFVQALADSGSDATHATGYICDFLTHLFSPLGFTRNKKTLNFLNT